MIGKARFNKLLEPFHIGRVVTRNRMIKTGAGMCYWNETDGFMNETFKAVYEGFARGGVGLIIVESPVIDYPLSMPETRGLRIDDDIYIQGLGELSQVIHKHGCPTFLQLLHGGPWHKSEVSGLQPVAASAFPTVEFPGFSLPRKLTITEIEEIEDKFSSAAERAYRAGFDGIEINAAASHLLATFLSRFWNKRQDAYGCGSLESRARIVVNVISKIKKRLGADFPVGVLINGAEYGSEYGITIEEGQGLAQILQNSGADAIQVRSHTFGSLLSLWPEHFLYPKPPENLPQELDWGHKGAGAYVPLAAAIKKAVSIPVITVGRLDAQLGEKILRKGQADFIGLTRRLLADPELPNKIASGRLDDILPCTACLHCIDDFRLAKPTRCRINAALGREREYEIRKAEKAKKVLVAGGGPAGMEAARVAALRGHEVILIAQEHKLGGLLNLAALVKGFEIEDLMALVHYFKKQITKLGIKARLGRELDLSIIDEIKPDVVILAIGGTPIVPEIPGINKPNVLNTPDLYKKLKIYLRIFGPRVLRRLTNVWMPVGKRVIIIGSAMQGCELAEFLVKRGRHVTIMDTTEEFGDGIGDFNKLCLFNWLAKKHVVLMPGIKFEEITDKGITILTREGNRQTIEADTIISAKPLTPNTDLIKIMEEKVDEIYSIGDCREPRLIMHAIDDGSRIGRVI